MSNKKAHPINQMSFEYFKKIFLSYCLTYLPLTLQSELELAPCPDKIGAGCQGFIGPFPSAFLDKRYFKELQQR